MTRIAVLFTVFALTGAPIANAICLTRCHSQLMLKNCDESMAGAAIASGPCPTLVAETTFVREDSWTTDDTPAALIVHPLPTSLTPARLFYVDAESRAVDGRRMPFVVLRL